MFNWLAAAPDAPRRRTVLVVEDEALTRLAVAETLRDCGLHVVETATAEEAWSYLWTGAAVDLVFSDIQMPGQMDGLLLARLVRQAYPEIPVVLTSGHVRPDASSGTPFIAKPYLPDAIAARLKAMLDETAP